MLLQEEVFTLEVLAVATQVQAQVGVLNLGTLVIHRKVPVQAQNHIMTTQAPKAIIAAAVVKQQKGVIFQYLFQYHLDTAVTAVEVISMAEE